MPWRRGLRQCERTRRQSYSAPTDLIERCLIEHQPTNQQVLRRGAATRPAVGSHATSPRRGSRPLIDRTLLGRRGESAWFPALGTSVRARRTSAGWRTLLHAYTTAIRRPVYAAGHGHRAHWQARLAGERYIAIGRRWIIGTNGPSSHPASRSVIRSMLISQSRRPNTQLLAQRLTSAAHQQSDRNACPKTIVEGTPENHRITGKAGYLRHRYKVKEKLEWHPVERIPPPRSLIL